MKRLRRICGDERTHGIDIQRQLIPIPSSDSQLEVSVWDFGGQHEYYNNHHYFLSARSVFLVVWKATEGVDDQLGVAGLEFWLNSLKATSLRHPREMRSPSTPSLLLGPTLMVLWVTSRRMALGRPRCRKYFRRSAEWEIFRLSTSR